MPAKFEIIHMAPEFTNSVLISRGDEAVIIDPWGRAEDWHALLAERGLNLRATYCTHGHPDHISAAPGLFAPESRRSGSAGGWFVNSRDHDLIQMEVFAGLMDYYGLPRITNVSELQDLQPGEIEILPGLNMKIIASPGHSGGGLVFYFPTEKILLFGDTLFQDCVGRYDLPGASHAELKKSIAQIYNMNLPDDTVVIHGHGMETTIGWLKENNRFFRG